MALYVNAAGITINRTHHPMVHPTKGWRGFARPAGKANRRRALIHAGWLLVPLSRANRLSDLRWNPCRWAWRRTLARCLGIRRH